MRFLYTSSHRGKGNTQLATCIGWATYAKIRLSKTKDSGELLTRTSYKPSVFLKDAQEKSCHKNLSAVLNILILSSLCSKR